MVMRAVLVTWFSLAVFARVDTVQRYTFSSGQVALYTMAAGVSGVSPGWAALANLVCTLAALPLGRMLGDGLAGRLLGRFALPLSGALLAALGVWEVLGG